MCECSSSSKCLSVPVCVSLSLSLSVCDSDYLCFSVCLFAGVFVCVTMSVAMPGSVYVFLRDTRVQAYLTVCGCVGV